MRVRNWTGMAFAALFTFTTACQDDTVGPTAGSLELSQSEIEDVAEMAADQIDLILDDETAANPSVVATGQSGLGISFSAAPVTTSFSWTRERECRNGGMVVANGQGTHVADRETGELTIDFSGDKTITDCARVRGDLVITINGAGIFDGHRHKLNGMFEGLQTNNASGSFNWVTSDGRSGECEYDIHVSWDPSTGIKTITGTVCDREINRTVTRDGAAGNDGRSG